MTAGPIMITGSPVGNIVGQDDIQLEGAPNVYFQEIGGGNACLNNPDSPDGFYWNLSGSVAYPVYALGCFENVTLGDNLTMNTVRCDAIGDKNSIMRRNFLDLKMVVKSLLPLSTLRHLIKGGAVTVNAGAHTEKMGIGPINNNRFYRFYLPKVYDDVAGAYVSFTLHRCKFVDAFNLGFVYGAPWTLSITVQGYADATLPVAQTFATVIRADANLL